MFVCVCVIFLYHLGFRGERRYTYRTETNILCLKLVTDGTTAFKGFNATYTKFYNGTDIEGEDAYKRAISDREWVGGEAGCRGRTILVGNGICEDA